MTATSGSSLEVPAADRRLDHEPPPAIAKLGWRYHHLGIPTDVARPGETYLEQFGLYVSGTRDVGWNAQVVITPTEFRDCRWRLVIEPAIPGRDL